MGHRPETHEEELESRAREILRDVVILYIESGEPISSRSLAKRGRFGLSSASIRNVMADLEDLGYLYQPHTSAGRVPTDRGYRFFINHLMKSKSLTQQERDVIDDQVSQTPELDDMMQLASKLLAKLTDQVAVVFMPNLNHIIMRSIDFILVAERKVLCVIVATNGVVVNKVIDAAASFTREELEKIGHYISGEFSGSSLTNVRDSLVALMKEERAYYDELLKKTISLGISAVEDLLPHMHDLYLEGASAMIRKSDFADADSLRKTFLAFEQKEKLVDILNRCLGEDGLQILIGDETPFTQNYNFALVATRCGSAENPMGLVGVIGPTRMEYARMGPLVDYLGRALSRKIEEQSQEQNS